MQILVAAWLAAGNAAALDSPSAFANSTGAADTFSTLGAFDTSNDFFRVLGSNGRSCDTCHRPENGWSLTPDALKARFDATAGTDPVFRTNDGSISPLAAVATLAQRLQAYSMLLSKAVFRIGLPIPEDAEFALVAVSDPYGFVRVGGTELSLFRRPLPTANLRFLSAVMWDGREDVAGKPIHRALINQADTATTGHAQGIPLSADQKTSIVDFESAVYLAQAIDSQAGALVGVGLRGGALRLSKQRFYSGINDLTGDAKTGAPFDPEVFTLFSAWSKLIESAPGDVRAAIARGQRLFNTRPFEIEGVGGLNDAPELGSPATVTGTCSTCHSTPNLGSQSRPRFMDTGTSDEVRRTRDLPLYTLRNRFTGEVAKTSDPGRALITGLWQDLNRFKVPALRGLAARPPYFHNGMAKSLGNVVDFYNGRFGLGVNNRERLDLLMFLGTL